MLLIAIVDDKKQNRAQVKNSLPGPYFAVEEHDSYSSFFKYHREIGTLPDILVLDYFLEQGKTGADLLSKFYELFPEAKKTTKVIGFSSIPQCSERLAKMSGGYGLKKYKNATYSQRIRSLIYSISKEMGIPIEARVPSPDKNTRTDSKKLEIY